MAIINTSKNTTPPAPPKSSVVTVAVPAPTTSGLPKAKRLKTASLRLGGATLGPNTPCIIAEGKSVPKMLPMSISIAQSK